MSAPDHAVDVRGWLSRALDDLRWARHSYQGGFLPQACFACQQAVEKALKALLLAHDKPLRRTHSLPELLRLTCQVSAAVDRFVESAAVLDAYYAPTRYADALQEVEYTKERVEDALVRAGEIMDYLRPEIEARLADV